jgi:hypothetical protein
VVKTLRGAAQKVVADPEWTAYVAANSLEALYTAYPDEAAMNAFYADWESSVSWLLFDAGVAKKSPADFNIPRSK